MELNKLKDPFPEEDIEWRVQRSGITGAKPWAMVIPYVTNRAIMIRLDEVVGVANWKNEFTTGPDSGVLCGISIKPHDEWITKWDGASNTNIEAVKGGLSGAMKRAAVQWGIGRYLYNIESMWAVFDENGKHKAKIDNKYFKWIPPQLPAWALTPDSKTFQEKMKAFATNNSGAYKKVLDFWQTESFKDVTQKDTQEGLLWQIELAIKKEAK